MEGLWSSFFFSYNHDIASTVITSHSLFSRRARPLEVLTSPHCLVWHSITTMTFLTSFSRALAAATLLIRLSSAQQCYFPNASPSTDIPCGSSGASSCCGSSEFCMDNGLCFGGGLVSRGSCTDKTWNSEACAGYCKTSQWDTEQCGLDGTNKKQRMRVAAYRSCHARITEARRSTSAVLAAHNARTFRANSR